MEQKNYSRPYSIKDFLYLLIAILLTTLIVIALIVGLFDYVFFALLFFIINELIFHPQSIKITNSTLTVTDYFLIGLIKRRSRIELDQIEEILNINMGNSYDDSSDETILFFWLWPGRGPIPFGLYQINFRTDLGRKNLKLNLYPFELKKIYN